MAHYLIWICSPHGASMTKPWITEQAVQTSGQIFLTITGEVFLTTHPLDILGFFHRRHLYTISVYTLKEVSSFRTRKLQVLSQNFVVTNSLIFHSFGNPVACNMHGSQDDKALTSRLLLLQCMCHSQPAIYKPRSLSLVWKATWSPQFEKGRNTSYYIKALIHN